MRTGELNSSRSPRFSTSFPKRNPCMTVHSMNFVRIQLRTRIPSSLLTTPMLATTNRPTQKQPSQDQPSNAERFAPRVKTPKRTQSRCETDESEKPEDHGEPRVASTPECQPRRVIHAFTSLLIGASRMEPVRPSPRRMRPARLISSQPERPCRRIYEARQKDSSGVS